MILSYHLLQLSVSPINWHLSRHCGVFCLFGLFCLVCVFWVLFVFVFLFFGCFWCFVLFRFAFSVLHQLTFDATLQQTAYA